jgi:hypothetical protein
VGFFGGILLAVLLVGQTHLEARPPGSDPAQDLADFGDSGFEVRSVKSLDPAAINSGIPQAVSKGEKWPQEAVLVALKMAGAGLKGSSKTIEVQTPPESQETAIITVTDAGFLDDAVGGERWRLWVSKGVDGTWSIHRVLWAQFCQRPGRRYYSAEKCP